MEVKESVKVYKWSRSRLSSSLSIKALREAHSQRERVDRSARVRRDRSRTVVHLGVGTKRIVGIVASGLGSSGRRYRKAAIIFIAGFTRRESRVTTRHRASLGAIFVLFFEVLAVAEPARESELERNLREARPEPGSDRDRRRLDASALS